MIRTSTLRIGVDSTSAVSGALAADQSIARVGRTAQVTEARVAGLSRGLGTLAGGFAALFGAAALGRGVRTLADFEQSLATVKAVTGSTTGDMAKMREEAKRLGAETRFTASQAADAMVFLGRAGFKTNQILATVPGTLQLAQAGGLDLAQATDIAAKVLRGFQLDVADMARVADVLAYAAGNASTDVFQLGEGLKFVAPVAKGMNISLEESVAAMAQLSNAGLQGSMAGTGLRRVLSGLESPTKKAVKILNDYGIEIDDVRPSVVGLQAALEQLGDKQVAVGDLLEIFGDRGGPASEVLKAMVLNLDDFTEALKNADGTAKNMSNTMDDNLNGSILRVQSAMEAVLVSVGDAGFTAGLRNTLDTLAVGLRQVAQYGDVLLVVMTLLSARALVPLAANLLLVRTGITAAAAGMYTYSIATGQAAAASLAIATNAALPAFFYRTAGAAVATATAVRGVASAMLSFAFGPTGLILAAAGAFMLLSNNAREARQQTQNITTAFSTLAGLQPSEEVKKAVVQYERLKTLTGDAAKALKGLTDREREAIGVSQTHNEVIAAQAELRRMQIRNELVSGISALQQQLALNKAIVDNNGVTGGVYSGYGKSATALRDQYSKAAEEASEKTATLTDQLQILQNGLSALDNGLYDLSSVLGDAPVDTDTIVTDESISQIDDFIRSMEQAMLVLSQDPGLDREYFQNMIDAGLNPLTDSATEAGIYIRRLTEEMYFLNAAEQKRLETERKEKREQDKKIKSYQDYIDELDTSIKLYGEEESVRNVRLAAMRIEQDLKRSDITLTADQVAELEKKLTLEQQISEMQRARSNILSEERSGLNSYLLTVSSLNDLYSRGLITQTTFTNGLREAQGALLQFRIDAGRADFAEGFLMSLERMSSGARNQVQFMSQTFESFFTSMSDGFANSVSRAIVYSEDLGSALLDVARGAIQQLIASFIQLGIQMLVSNLIGQSVAAAAVAASVTEAAALGTAWAPAAALASLATLGANAAPASAAIVGTVGMAKGIAAAGFEKGGWTGDAGTKEVTGVVHGQEFVVKAGVARRNRALLEAMNAGRTSSRSAGNPSAAFSGGSTAIYLGGVTVVEKEGEDSQVTGQRVAKAAMEVLGPAIDARIAHHKRPGGML